MSHDLYVNDVCQAIGRGRAGKRRKAVERGITRLRLPTGRGKEGKLWNRGEKKEERGKEGHRIGLLCLAVLSFALLEFRGRLVSLSRIAPEYVRNSFNLYSTLTPTANSSKKCPFQTHFWLQSLISRKNALFRPPGRGGHSRARKVKNYSKSITESHNEKSRDDF